MKFRKSMSITLVACVTLAGLIAGVPLALSGTPDALSETPQVDPPRSHEVAHHHGREYAAALQSKCCSCGGVFPREVARLCSSCSSKYRSKCCLCSGAFPKDTARLCSSCTSRFRSKCFLCGGAFPKDIARICSSCTSKY